MRSGIRIHLKIDMDPQPYRSVIAVRQVGVAVGQPVTRIAQEEVSTSSKHRTTVGVVGLQQTASSLITKTTILKCLINLGIKYKYLVSDLPHLMSNFAGGLPCVERREKRKQRSEAM